MDKIMAGIRREVEKMKMEEGGRWERAVSF